MNTTTLIRKPTVGLIRQGRLSRHDIKAMNVTCSRGCPGSQALVAKGIRVIGRMATSYSAGQRINRTQEILITLIIHTEETRIRVMVLAHTT